MSVIPELPLSLCKCTGSFLFNFFNRDRIIVANIKEIDPIIKSMAIIKIVHVDAYWGIIFSNSVKLTQLSSSHLSSFFLKRLIFQVLLVVLYLGIFLSMVPTGTQRIEALSLYGSRWALSEDSGFKSYPSRPEVYLVKKKSGAIDNNYGRQQLLGIRLQDSAFLSEVAVNHLKKARSEIWPKRSERRNNNKKKLPR